MRHQEVTGRNNYLIWEACVITGLYAPYTRQELAAALLEAADFLENKEYPCLSNAADMRDLLREAFPEEAIAELVANAKRSTMSVVAPD